MRTQGEGHVEEATGFEVGIVVPRLSRAAAAGATDNCVARLVRELEGAGLLVERVRGVSAEFIKLAAPMGTLGRAAAEMHMKKLTYIGMELQFQSDQVAAFVRQTDGSLFSWRERYSCFRYLIYGIVNKTNSEVVLKFDDKEFHWKQSESLLTRLEAEGVVKLVFPLHDEIKRKQLLRNWALNWLDFTWQPIDEIYSYFGTKIATYFAFLGMYARWLFFPAVFGLATQLIDFGSLQWLVLPGFFIFVISWAVLFLQFWKRKNSALLARWGIHCSLSEYKNLDNVSFLSDSLTVEEKEFGVVSVVVEKRKFQRNEWFGVLLRIRNNAIIVLAIICLQLPFELAYAHLYEIAETEVMRYLLTAVYLVAIQYYTRIGGKVSVNLIKYENNQGEESSSASLVYKAFGLYFMQSYIGLFYHASLHRDILALRRVLIQRLIVYQVLENLIENSIPYLKYSYKKYIAVHKKKRGKESTVGRSVRLSTRVEKEYLKPSYTASIGAELEDGLFDDFLELTLQFGMIMMFACAFPLIFCFAALNNVTELRADALKLLVMLKRPVPRAAATIGAWLNIFQFLVVMAICTNCLLLVCLYDVEGKWRIEPGLAAILIMEHALLLIKFGFSHFVPEEPAWVRANRVRYVAQAQNVCSKQLLRSISKFQGKLD
ncbi:anoctamin-like protein Os01g0706700 [Zea mays]|uniref:Anoctamin-like protein n=2 Tax=Zea mays TaxID=4577 RepID=A0A1D6G2Z3_MAIZE|nr:anoctamin-like protein Os01g0706700 [Zea mays]AQK97734.1 Anoctamin-like protein [Zea mays]AQK97735.1 Anoctamin-like protein [Zea mays]|eukprot:XP_020398259.1 anoctamin-like protein Os01g0706700 isoform X1 [Zea mays]